MLHVVDAQLDGQAEALQGCRVGLKGETRGMHLVAHNLQGFPGEHQGFGIADSVSADGYLHEVHAALQILSHLNRELVGGEAQQPRPDVDLPKRIDALPDHRMHPVPPPERPPVEEGGGKGTAEPDDVSGHQHPAANDLATVDSVSRLQERLERAPGVHHRGHSVFQGYLCTLKGDFGQSLLVFDVELGHNHEHQVNVGLDESRGDELSAAVDHPGSRWNIDFTAASHSNDPRSFHEHHPVGNGRLTGGGKNRRANDCGETCLLLCLDPRRNEKNTQGKSHCHTSFHLMSSLLQKGPVIFQKAQFARISEPG